MYKPRHFGGETPLWDFPEGTLCAREVATYVVARTLGWPNVPATVLRDGPYGIGSVQRFVAADPEEHYFTLGHLFPDEFRRVAAFDLGHLQRRSQGLDRLLGEDGSGSTSRIMGVLQRGAESATARGLHRGGTLEDQVRADLRRLASDLREGPVRNELANLLTAPERADSSRAPRRRPRWTGLQAEEDHRPFPGTRRSDDRRTTIDTPLGPFTIFSGDSGRGANDLRRGGPGRDASLGGSPTKRVDPPRDRRVLPWQPSGVRDPGRPVGSR